MLRKMEKLFRSYCFELKMLPDQIVENWCNKYYPDFALSVQHSWDYPGLFFYDFFVDYYSSDYKTRRYSVYLARNKQCLPSFRDSFINSPIGEDFTSYFNYTPIFFTKIPYELDSVFKTISSSQEKYYIIKEQPKLENYDQY